MVMTFLPLVFEGFHFVPYDGFIIPQDPAKRNRAGACLRRLFVAFVVDFSPISIKTSHETGGVPPPGFFIGTEKLTG